MLALLRKLFYKTKWTFNKSILYIKKIYFIEIKKNKEVVCIGDSHSSVFLNKYFNYNFKGFYFDITTVNGATVSGLSNPNSKTNANKIFVNRISNLKKDSVVIFLLGEVDLGFVIWYRMRKYNSSVEEMYLSALNNYKSLLGKCYCKKIIVISVPLPTIKDTQEQGNVANLRKEININQYKRTELTLRFNKEISAHCQRHGYDFIGLDENSLDIRTGLVKSELINLDIEDHHYNQELYAEILGDKLKYYL